MRASGLEWEVGASGLEWGGGGSGRRRALKNREVRRGASHPSFASVIGRRGFTVIRAE